MPDFHLAAQISTSHSAAQTLSLDGFRARLADARTVLPVGTLILGAREVPAVFAGLLASRGELVDQVYLWYNLLSDYPGQSAEEGVVNFRGERGNGWAGWQDEGVEESFRFSCPNHPLTRQKTLAALDRLLKTWPFDGVFLDKFRFPSPANGFEQMLSCFCPYCCRAAAARGLELEAVRARLLKGEPVGTAAGNGNWLERLTAHDPLLAQFVRFRKDSISGLVAEVRALTNRHGRRLGLDLFSPALAPLVGQDYPALARLADWGKPMTYREAWGPAGLRLELDSFLTGVERQFGVPRTAQANWMGWSADDLTEAIGTAIPLNWMAAELEQSVRQFAPAPVWFGLESVAFPGMIEITPSKVREMIQLGLRAGVNGAVLSWDLMHTPLENIRAVAESL